MNARGAAAVGHARLLGRSRWRVALLGALIVSASLAVLSAAAYATVRQVLVAGLYERLERVASRVERVGTAPADLLVDERGRPLGRLAVDRDAVAGARRFRIIRIADVGTLALLRLPAGESGPHLLAMSADDEQLALATFLRVLVALTLAGGVAAVPAGYVLASIALRPLDEAVRERSGFVALASHQLRTPLAVIRTVTELARDRRGLTPDEALRTISEQTRRMETLAQRLTALARAEAGVPAAAAEADLVAVATEQIEAFRAAATQADVRLRVEAPKVPVRVRATASEVADVLSVLVENAIRFSPPASAVTVSVGVDGCRGLVRVADRGEGIAPEDFPRVTLPFYQGRRIHGGHGLGLAIARTTVERRRGTLRIVSGPGNGTTVTAAFPFAYRPQATAPRGRGPGGNAAPHARAWRRPPTSPD